MTPADFSPTAVFDILVIEKVERRDYKTEGFNTYTPVPVTYPAAMLHTQSVTVSVLLRFCGLLYNFNGADTVAKNEDAEEHQHHDCEK